MLYLHLELILLLMQLWAKIFFNSTFLCCKNNYSTKDLDLSALDGVPPTVWLNLKLLASFIFSLPGYFTFQGT